MTSFEPVVSFSNRSYLLFSGWLTAVSLWCAQMARHFGDLIHGVRYKSSDPAHTFYNCISFENLLLFSPPDLYRQTTKLVLRQVVGLRGDENEFSAR